MFFILRYKPAKVFFGKLIYLSQSFSCSCLCSFYDCFSKRNMCFCFEFSVVPVYVWGNFTIILFTRYVFRCCLFPVINVFVSVIYFDLITWERPIYKLTNSVFENRDHGLIYESLVCFLKTIFCFDVFSSCFI